MKLILIYFNIIYPQCYFNNVINTKKLICFKFPFSFQVFETRVYLYSTSQVHFLSAQSPPMADSHHTGKHKSTVLLFVPLHLSSNPNNWSIFFCQCSSHCHYGQKMKNSQFSTVFNESLNHKDGILELQKGPLHPYGNGNTESQFSLCFLKDF